MDKVKVVSKICTYSLLVGVAGLAITFVTIFIGPFFNFLEPIEPYLKPLTFAGFFFAIFFYVIERFMSKESKNKEYLEKKKEELKNI